VSRLACLRDPRFLLFSAKRAGRSSLVTVRMLTRGARMLPGFLIVGGQRCGTTSMARALSQHPAMFSTALHQEVHYFDQGYGRGLAWYRSHFPLRARAQLAARAAGAAPVAFESSPYYMFHPLAADRIARDLPGVRLIVLVRDPVERAISAYTHEKARGFETETFERALELEPERIAGEREKMIAQQGYDSFHLQHNAYLTRGQYIEQLERLEAIFGRDRLHVVDSHEFFERPAQAYAAVVDFLGLPAFEGAVFDQHNARPRSPMPGDLAARLDEHFRPYDERLASWLGRTPEWRR
jgi:Sulfotransferase domain